jgi:mannose-6-phosphate isomerase-like protein (cupin superfamily)
MSLNVVKPWGNETIFTESSLPYTGKILSINSGKRISLQYHDQKTETLMLISGSAKITLDQTTNDMEPMRGYTIHPNTIHRIEAVSDCQIFEVSTPEMGTTVRLEDDYSRGNEIKNLVNNE